MKPTSATQANRNLLPLALLGIAPFLVNGLVNSLIAHNPLLYWGFELLTWIIIPACVLYAVSRTPGFNFADLGYHAALRGRHSPARVGVASLVLAPVVYTVYAQGYAFFSGILPDQGFFSYDSIVPDAGIGYYLVVIYFALSAGLVEEFLFRGLLFHALDGCKHSLALFLLISPLLFALVHWEDGVANLVTTWFVGVFMALAYIGLRNLWPLVIGHIFTDLVWFG